MMKDKQIIDRLLARFMAGQTTESEEQMLKESEQLAEIIQEAVEEQNMDKEVDVNFTSQYVLLTMNGALLFDSGKAQIREDAIPILDKVSMIEKENYDNIVISIKSSDVLMCAKAHEILAEKTNYPLHVGITEAGTFYSGNIKSALGLGIILNQGIGDTIRVSLSADPVEEVKSAKLILRTLGLRKGGIEVVSCPTCGRTKIDLIGLANKVETLVAGYDLDIKVAVMGCAVNGPGEAKEADIGIAGGIGEGLLFKHGEIIRKVPEDELLTALKDELDNWEI